MVRSTPPRGAPTASVPRYEIRPATVFGFVNDRARSEQCPLTMLNASVPPIAAAWTGPRRRPP
jgi:hypothetical protein